MAGPGKVLLRALAVSLPVALGLLAIGYSADLKQAPAGTERTPPATPVRTITLAPVTLTPRVIGHGTAEPAREWRAIARIESMVVETSDQLSPGEIVPAGTELLRLDDTDLRLSLAEIDASLGALAVKDQTLAASLEITRADLELSRSEMQRQQDLADQGVATRATLEQSRRQELVARAKVVDLENQLALNLAERRVLEARRALEARSLEFTTVVAPYDVRLTDVSAELGQVVSHGQQMIAAEGTEAVEIAARFPIGQVGPLVRMLASGQVTDLKARVRLPAADHSVTWDAKVVRVGEAVDVATQSSTLVVRVENPLDRAQAGLRPPLRRNTFVEVILSAPPVEVLVVPQEAVVNGRALVVSPEGTLEPREVTLGYTMEGIAVVAEGLAAGDRLVVTDPAIAVPGMGVKAMEDKATAARIAQTAAGGKTAAGAGKAR
ncbi:efflux RND transporter periplasmic adaptor subunit [Tropicimonas sp. IMCC34043]|uniref:efflux RND transporter periplasmic adaptor subunit n=1 Tax=Tropicimonas sp. IMCC34043 TaxID=2248760 RepID=UPI000E241B83|nr:HlyD family efflux transporter periplasmic adaptor subunit [Tropicimonas sp. IMCC34043]